VREELKPGAPEQAHDSLASLLHFATAWAVHAFQRIDTSHTYAAALMCSDADRASLDSIEVQWKAFAVRVPEGMLVAADADGTVHDHTRILVANYEGGATFAVIAPGILTGKIERKSDAFYGNCFQGPTVASLLFVDPEQKQETAEDRVVVMAKRLVAGLLLAMQNKDNFRDRAVLYKAGRPGRSEAEPEHRICVVGSPIQVDCRDAVRRYIERGVGKGGRKHAPPSVQTLVRGHYRRQAVGIGRLQRKVIWIQPFWRGPEDAPILTRPKAIV
jgi:hypothetical protein